MEKWKIAINRLNSTVGDMGITLSENKDGLSSLIIEDIETWMDEINKAIAEIKI